MTATMSNLIQQFFFYFFAVLAIASAVGVILGRNPVRAILFLVLTFFFTAALWIMLQAEFLGLILVVVYVGAVMTLFLFVVMMLDLNAIMQHKGLVKRRFLATLLVTAILAILVYFLGPWHFNQQTFPASSNMIAANYSSTQALGMMLFTHYLLPFELAGVLLLVAMIAAIALTKTAKPRRRVQDIDKQIAVKAKNRLRIVKDKELPQ